MANFLETRRSQLHGVWVPTDGEIKKQLGDLPPVFKTQRFTPDGFVEHQGRLLVPTYVASPLGFNKWGRMILDEKIHPRLIEAGGFPMDPFANCEAFLPKGIFNQNQRVSTEKNRWSKFNRKVVNVVNYGALMSRSQLLLSILDGPYADEGVVDENKHFRLSRFGPVVGIRTDFRSGENRAHGINPANLASMDTQEYGFTYFEGRDADIPAFEWIARYTQELLAQRQT